MNTVVVSHLCRIVIEHPAQKSKFSLSPAASIWYHKTVRPVVVDNWVCHGPRVVVFDGK
ncbi:MAG: hypothetical protein KAY65_07870 [Planctomycetes bacterium]|nr:hypothetical protein [Planctomycetota bacterium]